VVTLQSATYLVSLTSSYPKQGNHNSSRQEIPTPGQFLLSNTYLHPQLLRPRVEIRPLARLEAQRWAQLLAHHLLQRLVVTRDLLNQRDMLVTPALNRVVDGKVLARRAPDEEGQPRPHVRGEPTWGAVAGIGNVLDFAEG
jgi:hypothetical protein